MNPLKRLNEYFEDKSKPFLIIVNIAILLGIGLVDYFTGYEMKLSLSYVEVERPRVSLS